MRRDRCSRRVAPSFLRLLVVLTATVAAWPLGLGAAIAGPRIDLLTRLSIPLNDNVEGAAVGDFDLDGIPDIAAVHSYLANAVEIFRGVGSGRFEYFESIPTTNRPTEMVAVDLDHDGDLDLVMTGLGSAVTVLLGQGAGFGGPSFVGPYDFGVTQRSDDLAVADLDGDTHPDVAITHAFTATIDIFSGNGAGTFLPNPRVLTIPAASSSEIVAGDFNADGRADLAIGTPSGIVFIAGLGLGGYGTPVSSPLASGAFSLTSTDFDEDGAPDLAATDRAGSALLLQGTGDGHFTLAKTIPVVPGAAAITSGDLNADGRADLVVESPDDSVSVLLATGPGQFGAGVAHRAGYLPRTLLIADLDQDARQDLLTGNLLGQDLAILRGDGLGRFPSESLLSFPTPFPNGVQPGVPDLGAADFDGDGMTDLAVLQSREPLHFECGPPMPAGGDATRANGDEVRVGEDPSGPLDCGPQTVLVVPGMGQALFGPSIPSPARCVPTALAIADFNGDGRPDIATANRGVRDSIGICYPASLSVLAGDGHGRLATFIDLFVPDQPDDIVTGDFDGNGTPDLAVAFGEPRLVSVYRVAPGPTLVPAGTWVAPSAPRFLAAGDLTGDGRLDLAVALSDGRVQVLRGNGAGQILPAAECAPGPGGGTGPVSIGNFDGGGLHQIAAIDANSVRLLQITGAGAFCTPSSDVAIPAGAQGLAARDLNGDGLDDLLVTDGFTHISIVAGRFVPSFMPDDVYGAVAARAVITGDFDSDGLPDVAVATPNDPHVSVVRNVTPAARRVTLRLEDASGLFWTGVLGAAAYDVVRGSLATLRTGGGDFSTAVDACLANDLPSTSVIEPGVPAPGDGWWFLARPLFPAGPGSYDGEDPGQVGSRDAEIAASPLACP